MRVQYPEGNAVGVTYDGGGNLVCRTTYAKPASGLTALSESAYYDTSQCDAFGGDVRCYRPLWYRDARGNQTDFVFNTAGQLTEQTDPADASGVRRKTYVTYVVTNGISRRSVVRVCGDTTTCGTSAEIRTEYEYWGNTLLPSVERHIDAARGETRETHYSYDDAGRLLVEDGPLPGTGDAQYFRYDVYGRRTWEIGPLGSNGFRNARKMTYRDADDKVVRVEEGTVVQPDSAVLGASRAGDVVLDPFSGSGTTLVVAGQVGRGWLGCDINPEYNRWAVGRIENVQRKSVGEWIEFDRATAARRESIR